MRGVSCPRNTRAWFVLNQLAAGQDGNSSQSSFIWLPQSAVPLLRETRPP